MNPLALLQAKHRLTEARPRSEAEPVSQAGQILHVFLVVGICSVLGFGPLAFGAVQPWSMCLLEIGTAFLVILGSAREAVNSHFQIVPNRLFIPMALFATVVLVQIAFHLTAYWYATWSKALLWAAYAGIFFTVSQAFHRKPWITGFGIFCATYGFLISLFGIVQQFTSNGKLYWVVNNRYGGWIYGPYVNHAHYAGLMEMLFPFPLIFAIASREGRPIRAFFLFAAIVMSSTIFLSQSLGGMITFAAQLVVLSLILFRNRRSSYREMAIVGLLCLLLIAWLVWLRPIGLIERIARLLNPITDAGATGRVAIVKDSLRMVGQRPIFGWGLGTFPIAYPSFRSFFTNLWVNEAHNDFVQTLVETGIAGFACAIAFLVLFFRTAMYNSRHWRTEIESGMALAAFIGCFGLLVHGFVDFNLQIPANAAFFFALAALATSGFSGSSESGNGSVRMRG